MTKTRYTSGGISYYADYTYDNYGALTKMTKLTDWNDGTNGVQTTAFTPFHSAKVGVSPLVFGKW